MSSQSGVRIGLHSRISLPVPALSAGTLKDTMAIFPLAPICGKKITSVPSQGGIAIFHKTLASLIRRSSDLDI
jgi:hypothetical protein